MSVLLDSLRRWWQEILLAALLGAWLLAAAWLEPTFVTWQTQLTLSSHVWEMALIAIPMTLIIVTAGIDLSVGSTMGLCAVAMGIAFQRGWGIVPAAGTALIVGAAAGALNGTFVAALRVHPLIVTLATLAAYRGLAEGLSKGQPISGFPAWLTRLGTDGVHGWPVAGAAVVILAITGWLLLARTTFGRSLYAIGHNPTASRYSGIRVQRIHLLLYIFSGTVAAMAAIFFVSRRNTAKADIGQSMELDVITAVLLGGASMFGGRGHILGTLLGVALIHEVNEFVRWHWSRNELQAIVIGVLLITSVLLNSAMTGLSKSRKV